MQTAHGREVFVLGRTGFGGFWYFFPVAIGVKSPIGFLLLAIAGAAVVLGQKSWRGDWRKLSPLAAAAAVLVVAIGSRINIGVRHVLPIFATLSILAGVGAVWMWRASPRFLVATRGAVFALIVWTLASSARAHPDYLAYFNELAGDHPDRVLVDSDLDWGQDLDRLSTDLRTRGINNVSVAYFGTADLKRHALPPFAILKPFEHVAGWVAISITTLTKAPGYGWLSSYQPTARIGRSIELFDIPGTTAPTLKTAVAQERLH